MTTQRCILCLFGLLSALNSIHGAINSLSGQVRYLQDVKYIYQFESNSTLAKDIDMKLKTEITIYLMSESNDWQDLNVTITSPQVSWHTSTGEFKDQSTFANTVEWFTVHQASDGTINTVSYPAAGKHSITSLKKLLAQILSIGKDDMENVEKKPSASGVSFVHAYRVKERAYEKQIRKEYVISQNGEFVSVDLTEVILPSDEQASGLMNNQMSSHSRLVLLETVMVPDLHKDWGNLDNIVTETSAIVPPAPSSVPLNSVYTQIMELLSCVEYQSACKKEVVVTLNRLSIEDLSSLMSDIFERTEWLSSDITQALAFIDVLVKTSLSTSISDELMEIVFLDNVPDVVARRILFHFTTSLVPTENSIRKVMAFVKTAEVDKDLKEKALLALGSMARYVRDNNPTLSSNVTQFLHNMLEEYTSHSTTVDQSQLSSCGLMTIINSIGNAADNTSVNIVKTHAYGINEMQQDLGAQLAALRALSHHQSDEVADTLEEIAQTALHPQIQHASASAYMKHSKATKDLSHILKRSSSVSRSRRNTDNAEYLQYNVTMPSVNWGLSFGDDNITVDMSRNILNSFDIVNDPFSTEYIVSIRDEATFQTSLSLSSGQQTNKFLQTELCLEGTIAYDTNMETDYYHLTIVSQFDELQSAVDDLILQFESAYKTMKDSETLYEAVKSDFSIALDTTDSQLQLTSQYLKQFTTDCEGILNGDNLKLDAVTITSNINTSYVNANKALEESRQSLTNTLESILPLKLDAFLSSLLKDNQPFTLQSELVPYLQYAPQAALAGIYDIYWKSGKTLTELELSINDFIELTSKYGQHSTWINPYLSVWSIANSIDELLIDIELEKENAIDDGKDTTELQSLAKAISDNLKPALNTLINAADNVHKTMDDLSLALKATLNGYDQFTKGYESSRSTVDRVFGQRFYPTFPTKIRSCDPNLGCGTYPTTSGSRFRDGIDLVQSSNDLLMSPFAGYVSLFNTNSLENASAYNYSADNTILLTPTEFSLDSFYFIISNIDPYHTFNDTPMFVTAGEVIGATMELFDTYSVHIEAYKTLGDKTYTVNPTQFVPPVLKPKASIMWDCNEITTIVNGMVVGTQTVASSNPNEQPIGSPLVTIDVDDEEFPQPYDLILDNDVGLSSAENVEFFQSSTFLMVGVIPVTFSFSAYGQYNINMSLYAALLSRTVDINITPEVWGEVEGYMKVGDAIYATVTIDGMLLNGSLPLTINQDYGTWPLSASSNMDLILHPTSLNMTTQLIQRVGVGNLATETVLETNVLWSYDIPDVNLENEFYYIGTHMDTTPPLFTTLPYSNNDSYCSIKQLTDRDYTNPAFEIEFEVVEEEGLSNVQLMIGTYENGDDVLSKDVIRGERLVLANQLSHDEHLIATISATNQNGLQSFAHCILTNYDSSPPQARVIPFSDTTSHPNEFQVLLALFDEYGLTDDMEIAVGTTKGNQGNDLLDWITLKTSRVNEVIDEEKFSFSRNGRLIENVISVLTEIDDNEQCSLMCEDHADCLSYDYSESQDRCILHSSIEGPATLDSDDFVNTFETLPLQDSKDFVHYEALGKGHITIYTLSGLELQQTQNFFINLKLQNKLGYTSIISSTDVLVDMTPPSPGRLRNATETLERKECGETFNIEYVCGGETTTIDNHRIIYDGMGSATIFNGPTPLSDALYTKANNFIAANWDGIEDRESGLLAYTWCISSSTAYDCDIEKQNNPHGTASEPSYWTNTGLARFSDLLDDGNYYITVNAINKVGYGGSLVTTIHHTTPFVLDTTTPVVHYLTIVEYDIVNNILSVEFSVSDSGSNIKEVSISLGTTSDNTEILPWTLISSDASTFIANVSVEVPDGVNGWVKLRAVNNVNLQTIITSATPIIIDRSPPTVGMLNDGSIKGSNVNYQSDTTQICANWVGVSDPHSGISSVHWGVGTSPNDYDTIPLQNVTDEEIVNSLVCAEDVTLVQDTVYYSSLIITNGADDPLTTIISSNGVLIDNTPPNAGSVMDGGSPDIQYSHSLTTLSASWSGFNDLQSGINRYTVEVERKSQGSSDFLTVLTDNINTGTSYFGNQFSFSNGDEIRVKVTAFNGAGLTSSSTSNGYSIDLTAPEVTTLQDGLNSASDMDYLASSTNYSVNWIAFDNESGVSAIEIALFHLSAGKKNRIFPDILSDSMTQLLDDPSMTSYNIEDIQLVHGYKYIAVVTFTNGAGLKASFETNGATIDLISPIVHGVSVFGDTYLNDDNEANDIVMLGSAKQVEASWEGSDDSSGIATFSLSIIDDDDTIVESGYATFNGQVRNGRISGLDLSVGNSNAGPFYRVRVTATDNAGHESQPLHSEKFWISGEDYAGTVYDGYYSFDDIDYTDELSSISTYFSSFFSQQCGGIVQYQWAVGHGDDDKSSILSYTESGMVVVGNGSGYAQLLLPDLSNRQSEELFITVRGITGCGDILESTSNGFTVDSSPPAINIHGASHKAVENISSNSTYQTEQTFSSIWTVSEDSGEIIDHVTVSIGSYPGGKDFVNETEIAVDHIRENIMAPEGVSSYVTVTARNRAGLETIQYSNPVVMDTSSPQIEFIKCSHSNDLVTQLNCYWNAIDSESDIDYLIISLATDKWDKYRITSTKPSSNSCSFSFDYMNYSTNQSYYVTLYAYNKAGLESIVTSEPIYIDTSPPTSEGLLYVLPNFGDQSYTDESGTINTTTEALCLWDTDVATLIFSQSSDKESNIKEYQLGIGHLLGGDDVLAFHTVNVEFVDDVWATYVLSGIDSVYSKIREPYYFTIRSFNNAGLYYDIVSMPVYSMSEDNTKSSWIIDGDRETEDRDYQYSATQANGRAFFGINCPMRSVEWSVQGVDGVVVKNFTEIDLKTAQYSNNTYSFSTDQVMYDDETYRLIVRGVDYSGQVHVLKSDGILVTKRPLAPGLVVEGIDGLLELNYQESLTMLTINYNDFGDGTSEQEIEYYEVALGSDKDYLNTRSDIVPFTNVGLAKTYTFSGLDLIPLTQSYFATVRAHAVSGAFVDASSNGIVVGLTHSIKPGMISQTPYQTNSSFLSAYWTGFESDVAITKYEWALGTYALNYSFLQSVCNDRTSLHDLDFQVFGFKELGTDTYAIEYNLNLQHGLEYYVTLRVTDQSDKCISVSSAVPTVIDKTAPVVKKITIGPEESRVYLPIENEYIAYLIDSKTLTVSWEGFVDLESDIKNYEVGFFKLDSCSSNSFTVGATTVDYVDVGLVNESTFEDLELDVNTSYVAQIRATNQAGLKVVGRSNPVMVDTYTLTAGEVKDGSNWKSDLVFQNDLTKLSGVISLSYFQPQNDPGTPCPSNKYYSFDNSHADWSNQPFTEFNGLKSSAIRYETDIIDFSSDTGMSINAILDPTEKQLVSGTYFTTLSDLSGQKTISMTVHPALGDERLQRHIVTSILIFETSNDKLLVEYDPTVQSESSSNYKALGLQIHTQESSTDKQQLILWSKDDSYLPMVRTVSQNVSLNISKSLQVRFEFFYEEYGLIMSRKVAVYIDNVLTLALHDIPQFTANSKLVLHMFNREGYLPECIGPCASDPPEIVASFSHVSLPSESNGVCSYGKPFYSWGSPVTEVRAGIGTSTDVIDIKPLEVVFVPCRPCISTPCYLYGCEKTCPPTDDPQIVTFSFAHLSLSPSVNDTQPAFSGSGLEDDMIDAEDSVGYFNPTLQPAVYYIIVETTSASGQIIRATSNGVLIDVTPPIQDVPIRLYDAEFSLSQSSVYQGNNHTISASWGFEDLESGIQSYEWSIGTTPYGQQIQKFVSVGLKTLATNSDLEGVLLHNETYYVTVRATNGAGLYSDVSSTGITHLSIELNETDLDNGIVIESSKTITDANNVSLYIINNEEIGLLITSTREDVAEISWGIGSHIDQQSLFYDVFPLTDITNGKSVHIDRNTFYINDSPHSNVSDILALSDGVNPSEIDGFYIEPGRIFYHVVEFCDLAHSCIQSSPRESISIRTSDVSLQSTDGENLNITILQQSVNSSSVLNSNYSLTIMTSGGLQKGTWMFAGFLSQEDVTQVYHVGTPYISNPYLTMDQTSRELARRFSSIGGPSFFVSFFGQEMLEGELIVTTTFDSSVDWTESVPRLAYWDIDNSEWREVEDTCGSVTAVNLTTHTLSVEVCSTIADGVNINNRPSSLSRRRRNIDSESGSGVNQDSYLERPIQFIVIERGNVSSNTPPTLVFDSVVMLNEDETFTYQIPYEDLEEDEVLFYLTSLPKRGTAMVDSVTGVLTYTPCENCFGYDVLDIYIKETNLQFGEGLDARGTLQLYIANTDDPLVSFLFESTLKTDTAIWPDTSISVYVEANRTKPVTVARMGVYDYDGYEDDIQTYVTIATEGSSGYNIWLDVVSVPESLPVDWTGYNVENFTGYISFLGVDVTFLPSDPNFLGTDKISVYANQEDKITTPFLEVNIIVIPSLCLNNGVCGGSLSDPDCINITNRINNPGDYNCSCTSEYSGLYCQDSVSEPIDETQSECPNNIPKMDCNGNPCDGAACPGYTDAECVPDYCGDCKAVWYSNGQVVQCSASDEDICLKPLPNLIIFDPSACDNVMCNCPSQAYECPDDSIFIETRIDGCCVIYTCQCLDISCPLLMDSSKKVMPQPEYRGGKYSGRCCPMYTFNDINECLQSDLNMCSHYCMNDEPSYSCTCDEGVTLSSNGHNCGVCTYNEVEYLYGDRVKIGCNWCTCQADDLSGERWHCTAESCNPSCYYNGMTYPVDSMLTMKSVTCSCEATDTFAEWECQSSL